MNEKIALIQKILDRAEYLDILQINRETLYWDLRHTDDNLGLKLKELSDSEDQSFIHDIEGIQKHINRTTFLLENEFLPIYSK